MTNPLDLNYIPCEKIDPSLVSAYLEFDLCKTDPTKLHLDTSWGEMCLDLLPAFSGAADMLGTLRLAPSLEPAGLELDLGKLGSSYIPGEDLNRILYMAKLHDVDQTKEITDGDVLLRNGLTSLFEPFNLKQALLDLEGLIAELERRVKALEDMDYTLRIAEIRRRIREIEERLEELEKPPVYDWGDIDYIDDSGKLQTYVFQSYNDFRTAGGFQTIVFPNANFEGLTIPKNRIRRIRIGTSVTKIPDRYGVFSLGVGDWTFTLDPIPDSVVEIGSDFFRLNGNLAGGTTIPASVEYIGPGFMSELCEFTGPLVLEVPPASGQTGLTAYSETQPTFTKGITLTGPYAQAWKNALPDSSSGPYRKLIVR